jgi:phytoene dehydrogenase-like protein
MVLVSIASVLDPNLAPAGKHVIHAYTPAGAYTRPLFSSTRAVSVTDRLTLLNICHKKCLC